MFVAFMAALILVFLVYFGIKNEKDKNDKNDKNENKSSLLSSLSSPTDSGTKNNNNINERIDKAFINYKKDISKYNIGPKSYEYNFIDNEQPLNGLSPNFSQNYPSTLKKSNKMFVNPDLSIKYDNLLNTRNNSIKNYVQ
jgi:hypothetical protein